MQSGMSRLAAVIRAQRAGEAAGDLFFAKVTPTLALDDGCGVVVPGGEYVVCAPAQDAIATAPDSDTGVDVLCAWVGAQAVIIAMVN